jgi:hypothetical protein
MLKYIFKNLTCHRLLKVRTKEALNKGGLAVYPTEFWYKLV